MNHGEKLDGELAGPSKPRVEVLCVNDHPFAITKDDLRTTETGKSAIAFCPACGGVARVTKANVGKLYGFKRNDTKAFLATLKAIRSAQLNVSPGGINQPSSVSTTAPDLSRGENPVVIVKEGVNKEYIANEEIVDGPGGRVTRYRVRGEDLDDGDDEGDEDEDNDEYEDDDDDEYEPSRGRRRPRRLQRRQRRTIERPKPIPEEDLEELDVESERERERREQRERVRKGKELIDKRSRRMPIIQEDVEFDSNRTLKEIVAESGLDDYTLERIFDYIDMQPDGWQPAAIQGVLQMYMPQVAAQRLASRYQAEISKETKRRDREQQALSLIGNPAGNIRLSGGAAMNQPPMGYPSLNERSPMGAPLFAQGNSSQIDQSGFPQDPRAYIQRGDNPYVGLNLSSQRARGAASMGEVREYVDSILARERESMAREREMIAAQRREEEFRREIAELRQKVDHPPAPPAGGMDELQKLYVQSLQKQVDRLMEHALVGGKTDLTGLIAEIRDLKKSTDQPIPGISGVPSTAALKDLVELQKLSNDINVAKLDFQESMESKKFTKDLVEGALQQIGQTIATVYTARSGGAGGISSGSPMSPTSTVVPMPPPSTPPAPPASLPTPASVEEVAPKTYNVKAQAKEGKMQIPCPLCGGVMSASPGDAQVTCPNNPAHKFGLEPPKDVVEALTKPVEKLTESAPEKPTDALVESIIGERKPGKLVVPPSEDLLKTYGGVM